MSDCVIIVRQLVPYHDARFSSAARHVDFAVIEVFGQDKGLMWSDDVLRSFCHISLAKDDSVKGSNEPLRQLEVQLDKLMPKIVAIQGWSDPAALTTAKWALSNYAKIIIFSESNRYDQRRIPWKEWLKARVLNVCDASLVGGRDHIAYLVDLGFERDRITLGYNAIDNEHFRLPVISGETETIRCSKPYFLVVSRLVEIKNIENVIKAFADYCVRSTGKCWDLLILGTGHLEQRFRRLISDLHIEENVRLEGFRKYSELPGIYQNAGALVHASTVEPWGLVVNEAMASGLPVIVSNRCGCCCELVQEGVNGFTFDPENAQALAELMVLMAEGSVDRISLGRNSRRIIADWGPLRFASGFREAIEIACSSSKEKPYFSKLCVRILAQWK